jgi:hypothetical protein
MLLFALILIGVAAYQWFSQEVSVKLWGPLQVSFHRDEWPAFYWIMMLVEVCFAALLLYCYFA